MKEYIGVKIEDGVIGRLLDMGYLKNSAIDDEGWVFIILHNSFHFGELTSGCLNKDKDHVVDIDDIPFRKDLDEYVKVLNEGNKMGLL